MQHFADYLPVIQQITFILLNLLYRYWIRINVHQDITVLYRNIVIYF